MPAEAPFAPSLWAGPAFGREGEGAGASSARASLRPWLRESQLVAKAGKGGGERLGLGLFSVTESPSVLVPKARGTVESRSGRGEEGMVCGVAGA